MRGKTNSNFFRASLNARSVKGFFIVAILSVTASASGVGLKSYTAGICDAARFAERFVDYDR